MSKFFAGLIAIWLFLAPLEALAAGAALTVAPSAPQIQPGETLTVTASIADIADLYGFQIRLQFDPALLQVVPLDGAKAAEPGALITHDFVAQNVFDNAKGTVDYAATQINPHEPVSGSGTLLQLQFRGVAAGTARVDVGAFILTDLDGMALAATATGAQVVVGAAVGAAPTGTTSTPTSLPIPGGSGNEPTAAAPTATNDPRVSQTPPPPAAPSTSAPARAGEAAAPATRTSNPPSAAVPDATAAVSSPKASSQATPGAASTVEALPGAQAADSGGAGPGTPETVSTPGSSPTAQVLAAVQRQHAPAVPAPALAPPTRVDARASLYNPRAPSLLLKGGVALLLAAAVLVAVAGVQAGMRRGRRA